MSVFQEEIGEMIFGYHILSPTDLISFKAVAFHINDKASILNIVSVSVLDTKMILTLGIY